MVQHTEQGELNERQIRFAQEYIIDLNGTEAYKRAGYETKDDAVAGACASRLLNDARVSALVDELKVQRNTRLKMTADYAMKELMDNLNAAKQKEKFGDVNKAIELILKHRGELDDDKGKNTGAVIFNILPVKSEPE